MRVFVAGATGVVGNRLVPLLVASGFHVVALTRSLAEADRLRTIGCEPVVADAMDRDQVIQAIGDSGPQVIVHHLTGLTGIKSFKKFDDEFALTNRLRTQGTDNLMAAAKAAGVRRVVAQSFGNWNYERTGPGPKTEEDPLDPSPPANQRQSLRAIRHVERAITEAEEIDGLALRYGNFYGPGTGFAHNGNLAEMVRQRKMPIVGDGAGIWSFIHMDDVATATIAAIERGGPGVYNIADDEPAPVATWLPEYARALGAKPPRRVPVWLGRLAIGEVGVSLMTQIRGASNAKAKRHLGWAPQYASWRDGFRDGLDPDLPLPPPVRKDDDGLAES